MCPLTAEIMAAVNRGVRAQLCRLGALRATEVTFFCRSSIGKQLILNSVKWLKEGEGLRLQSMPTDISRLCVSFKVVSGCFRSEEQRHPTERLNSLKSSPSSTWRRFCKTKEVKREKKAWGAWRVWRVVIVWKRRDFLTSHIYTKRRDNLTCDLRTLSHTHRDRQSGGR